MKRQQVGFAGHDDQDDVGNTAVTVTFTEPESLGIKFVDNPHLACVQVKVINPDTQAELHAALRPGLVLMVVGGTSVRGMSYKVRSVIDKGKTWSHTLVCTRPVNAS